MGNTLIGGRPKYILISQMAMHILHFMQISTFPYRRQDFAGLIVCVTWVPPDCRWGLCCPCSET
jgi:hypothetical protein